MRRLAIACILTLTGCGGGQSAPAAIPVFGSPQPTGTSAPMIPRPGSTYKPSPSVPQPSPTPANLPTVTDGQRSDAQILSHINSEIIGQSRNEIYDVLEQLPEEMRSNVVELTNSGVYATSQALASDAIVELVPTSNAVTRAAKTNEILTAINKNQKCGYDTCTGVGHVVTTNSSRNMSYASASVYVPCSTSRISKAATEGGFIYMGGSTAKTSAQSGKQADMGIQLNAPNGQDPGTPTSVQIFASAEQELDQTLNGKLKGATRHLECDTTIQMTFFVKQSTRNAAISRLNLNVRDSKGAQTIVVRVNSSTGWSQPCIGCNVKRVTGLAVEPYSVIQRPLGTWLGVSNPRTSPKPLVEWSDVIEGRYLSPGEKTSPVIEPWSEYNEHDDPADGQKTGVILVDKRNAANESVGINLTSPHLILKNPSKN